MQNRSCERAPLLDVILIAGCGAVRHLARLDLRLRRVKVLEKTDTHSALPRRVAAWPNAPVPDVSELETWKGNVDVGLSDARGRSGAHASHENDPR